MDNLFKIKYIFIVFIIRIVQRAEYSVNEMVSMHKNSFEVLSYLKQAS